jgi:hypothetical protein
MDSLSIDDSDLYHATSEATLRDRSGLIRESPVTPPDKTACGGKLTKKQAYCAGVVGILVLVCIIALGVTLTRAKDDSKTPRFDLCFSYLRFRAS